MKIKIIDLLNKIANNEEVPKKIYYLEETFTYDEQSKDYYDSETYGLFDRYEIPPMLNDEVEILETTITYKQDDNIKKLEEKTSEIRFAIEHLGIETVLATYSSKINEIIEVIYEK